jgi:ketosteroid isomerase-like protein
MPSRERVQAFVDAVLAKDFVQSIRDFYAEDATAQENLQPPRVGREALIAHETKALRAMGKVEPHLTTLLVDGDRVVIGWRFDMTSHDGVTRRLDEPLAADLARRPHLHRAVFLRSRVDTARRGKRRLTRPIRAHAKIPTRAVSSVG